MGEGEADAEGEENEGLNESTNESECALEAKGTQVRLRQGNNEVKIEAPARLICRGRNGIAHLCFMTIASIPFINEEIRESNE